ncbi:helix-turn-helix domain-containing protein [Streptomyces sp. CAU 1734]|uniref:winged helix-turn-helix transcriptional regulator n=1 Tax=Streptomyces sp. CAU 1734 TaxID=3140360 RepID=UPI003260B5F0
MVTVGRPGGPDAYHCGIDAAMDVTGGKWKVLILWALEGSPRRFGELRRMLPGVTEKVLTTQLRELEADGVVVREAYDEVPPRVEYALTGPGAALGDALVPLGRWGRAHVLGQPPLYEDESRAGSPAGHAGGGTPGDYDEQPRKPGS